MMISPEDIARRCGYHPALTDERKSQHERARAIVQLAITELNELVPVGRELSCAITHLEEAMFWANAGIARQSEDGDPTPGPIGG